MSHPLTDDQVEELADFRLEAKAFASHFSYRKGASLNRGRGRGLALDEESAGR